MQVGWLLCDEKYHITNISDTDYTSYHTYHTYNTICLNMYIDDSRLESVFMWPDGVDIKKFKPFSRDTLCNKCVSIYIKKHSKEKFNFEFIKLKLGIKCLN